MKTKASTIILSLAVIAAFQSCDNNSSNINSAGSDSATIQTSEDKNKESTFSGNQYANDSTVTRTDTSSRNASNTYSTNQYSSDSNVIKK